MKHYNLYYLLKEDCRNNPLAKKKKRCIKRKVLQRYRKLQIDKETKRI